MAHSNHTPQQSQAHYVPVTERGLNKRNDWQSTRQMMILVLTQDVYFPCTDVICACELMKERTVISFWKVYINHFDQTSEVCRDSDYVCMQPEGIQSDCRSFAVYMSPKR